MAFDINAQLKIRLNQTVLNAELKKLENSLSKIGSQAAIKIDITGGGKNLSTLNRQLHAIDRSLKSIASGSLRAAQGLQQMANAINAGTAPALQLANSLKFVTVQTAKMAKVAQTGQSFVDELGETLGLAAKRVALYITAGTIFFNFIQLLGDGASQALEFQKQMIKLEQVTTGSVLQVKAISDQIGFLSTNLGVSSKSLAEASLVFKQAGLSAKDTAIAIEVLAKTSLAPTFGDNIKTANAMIAAMQQLGLKANQLNEAFSAINTVSAAFAVESEDIAVALSKAGGAFKVTANASNDAITNLQQFLALFTSVRDTTRESADSIATGIRTIFARIERPKTIDYFRSLGIELQTVEGRFVGAFEAVQKIGTAIKNLPEGDLRLAGIVEEVGGLRQISRTVPLLQQLDKQQKALAISQASKNSLDKDAAKAQETLSVQINKVKESFLLLFREISENKALLKLLDIFLKLTDTALSFARTIQDVVTPSIIALGTVLAATGSFNFASSIITGKAVGTGGKFARGIGFVRKNQGGSVTMVPGQGDTDSVPAQIPVGSFVIRKKAVSALTQQRFNKFNRGGSVSALLTPGEAIIPPEVVNKIGIGNLQKANRADSYQKFGLGGLGKRTGQLGRGLFNIYNLLPNLSATSLKRAGFSDNVASRARVANTALDTLTHFPFASLGTIGVSALRKPSAPVEAVSDLIMDSIQKKRIDNRLVKFTDNERSQNRLTRFTRFATGGIVDDDFITTVTNILSKVVPDAETISGFQTRQAKISNFKIKARARIKDKHKLPLTQQKLLSAAQRTFSDANLDEISLKLLANQPIENIDIENALRRTSREASQKVLRESLVSFDQIEGSSAQLREVERRAKLNQNRPTEIRRTKELEAKLLGAKNLSDDKLLKLAEEFDIAKSFDEVDIENTRKKLEIEQKRIRRRGKRIGTKEGIADVIKQQEQIIAQNPGNSLEQINPPNTETIRQRFKEDAIATVKAIEVIKGGVEQTQGKGILTSGGTFSVGALEKFKELQEKALLQKIKLTPEDLFAQLSQERKVQNPGKVFKSSIIDKLGSDQFTEDQFKFLEKVFKADLTRGSTKTGIPPSAEFKFLSGEGRGTLGIRGFSNKSLKHDPKLFERQLVETPDRIEARVELRRQRVEVAQQIRKVRRDLQIALVEQNGGLQRIQEVIKNETSFRGFSNLGLARGKNLSKPDQLLNEMSKEFNKLLKVTKQTKDISKLREFNTKLLNRGKGRQSQANQERFRIIEQAVTQFNETVRLAQNQQALQRRLENEEIRGFRPSGQVRPLRNQIRRPFLESLPTSQSSKIPGTLRFIAKKVFGVKNTVGLSRESIIQGMLDQNLLRTGLFGLVNSLSKKIATNNFQPLLSTDPSALFDRDTNSIFSSTNAGSIFNQQALFASGSSLQKQIGSSKPTLSQTINQGLIGSKTLNDRRTERKRLKSQQRTRTEEIAQIKLERKLNEVISDIIITDFSTQRSSGGKLFIPGVTTSKQKLILDNGLPSNKQLILPQIQKPILVTNDKQLSPEQIANRPQLLLSNPNNIPLPERSRKEKAEFLRQRRRAQRAVFDSAIDSTLGTGNFLNKINLLGSVGADTLIGEVDQHKQDRENRQTILDSTAVRLNKKLELRKKLKIRSDSKLKKHLDSSDIRIHDTPQELISDFLFNQSQSRRLPSRSTLKNKFGLSDSDIDQFLGSNFTGFGDDQRQTIGGRSVGAVGGGSVPSSFISGIVGSGGGFGKRGGGFFGSFHPPGGLPFPFGPKPPNRVNLPPRGSSARAAIIRGRLAKKRGGQSLSRFGGFLGAAGLPLAIGAGAISQFGGTSLFGDLEKERNPSGSAVQGAGIKGALEGGAAGAIAGSFTGTFAPFLVPLLAAGGAIAGFASGVREASKQVKEANFARDLDKFSLQLNNVANGLSVLSPTNVAQLGIGIKRVRGEASERFIDPSDKLTFRAKSIDIAALIGAQQKLVENSIRFSNTNDSVQSQTDAAFQKILDAGNGSGFIILEEIADRTSKTFGELEKELKETIKEQIRFKTNTIETNKLLETLNNNVVLFDALGKSVDTALIASDRFGAKLSTLGDQLTGNISLSRPNVSNQLDLIGQPGGLFGEALKRTLAPLGNNPVAGSAQSILTEIDQFLKVGPAILGDILKNPLLSKDNLSNQFDKALQGTFPNLKELVAINLDRSEADPSKLRDEFIRDPRSALLGLLGGETEKFLSSVKQLGVGLTAGEERFSKGLDLLGASVLNLVQEFDTLNRVVFEQEQFRLKVRGIQSGFGQDAFGVSTNRFAQLFDQSQTKLICGVKNDPRSIFEAINDERAKLEGLQEDFNNGVGGQKVEIELKHTQIKLSLLNEALRRLADPTNRLANINEQLVKIEQDRASRQSQFENFFGSDLGGRFNVLRQQEDARRVVGAGTLGNLFGGRPFSIQQQQNAVQFLQQNQGTDDLFGSGFNGGQLLQKLFENSGFVDGKPFFGQKAGTVAQRDGLFQKASEEFARAAEAQRLIIQNQETLQKDYFTELKQENKNFLDRLNGILAQQVIAQLEVTKSAQTTKRDDLVNQKNVLGKFGRIGIDSNNFEQLIARLPELQALQALSNKPIKTVGLSKINDLISRQKDFNLGEFGTVGDVGGDNRVKVKNTLDIKRAVDQGLATNFLKPDFKFNPSNEFLHLLNKQTGVSPKDLADLFGSKKFKDTLSSNVSFIKNKETADSIFFGTIFDSIKDLKDTQTKDRDTKQANIAAGLFGEVTPDTIKKVKILAENIDEVTKLTKKIDVNNIQKFDAAIQEVTRNIGGLSKQIEEIKLAAPPKEQNVNLNVNFGGDDLLFGGGGQDIINGGPNKKNRAKQIVVRAEPPAPQIPFKNKGLFGPPLPPKENGLNNEFLERIFLGDLAGAALNDEALKREKAFRDQGLNVRDPQLIKVPKPSLKGYKNKYIRSIKVNNPEEEAVARLQLGVPVNRGGPVQPRAKGPNLSLRQQRKLRILGTNDITKFFDEGIFDDPNNLSIGKDAQLGKLARALKNGNIQLVVDLMNTLIRSRILDPNNPDDARFIENIKKRVTELNFRNPSRGQRNRNTGFAQRISTFGGLGSFIRQSPDNRLTHFTFGGLGSFQASAANSEGFETVSTFGGLGSFKRRIPGFQQRQQQPRGGAGGGAVGGAGPQQQANRGGQAGNTPIDTTSILKDVLAEIRNISVAIQSIPKEIILSATHAVTVTVNGGEVLAKIKGEVESLIRDGIKSALAQNNQQLVGAAGFRQPIV